MRVSTKSALTIPGRRVFFSSLYYSHPRLNCSESSVHIDSKYHLALKLIKARRFKRPMSLSISACLFLLAFFFCIFWDFFVFWSHWSYHCPPQAKTVYCSCTDSTCFPQLWCISAKMQISCTQYHVLHVEQKSIHVAVAHTHSDTLIYANHANYYCRFLFNYCSLDKRICFHRTKDTLQPPWVCSIVA